MNMILSALPDVSSQIRSLQNALHQQTERVAALEEELRQERMKSRSVERGVTELRDILSPLHQALGLVFGQIDAMDIAGRPVPNEKRAAWDSWKLKLGGLTAKAIDILLLHGPMNQTQLRIQLSCAKGSVPGIVSALNKAGLINKADGKIALKEL